MRILYSISLLMVMDLLDTVEVYNKLVLYSEELFSPSSNPQAGGDEEKFTTITSNWFSALLKTVFQVSSQHHMS
jgi:hypothetical protein